ncbi:hypothetical protein NQ176_g4504 [Zarea fungicola]|uniref:Uncharacterized protein n=1 Tax=Zarea fungicola TaxID=93591 RepID=A0ACC1ND35_9HYPO|nr:hypothetical protein NQ176_g4504 [Lecanicillium fungicola]
MIKDFYICLILATISGLAIVLLGEVCNLAAYTFAPATLVTPLGALSVVVGAILGSYILEETLGKVGRLGVMSCLVGAVLVVLHAPPDKPFESVDQVLRYAIRPGFLIYSLVTAILVMLLIVKVSPVYGKRNVLVYITICSLTASISIMCVKAFGIAVRLTFTGKNQFVYASTYAFFLLAAIGLALQMNYFNKALAAFPSNIVNPVYYVAFTTATLCANFTLYGSLELTGPAEMTSLSCGLLVTFAGIYLLHWSQSHSDTPSTMYEAVPLE